ncbi:FG-GAP-like repeat-containing protein, partial [Arthrobacter sp. H5]|uniref:FG-GAP-like repeat-containing protein n=1 Tax=Arthrobacter sp. H5 TaxID=1267973 RepID=UPI001563FE68
MTIANPLRLLCAAALSLVLMGGGIPALAAEETTAVPPSASPSPAEAPPASAVAETAPALSPDTEPAAPGGDTADPAPLPSTVPSEPQMVPAPTDAASNEVDSTEPAPDELTSEVPPADWDPTLEPGFDPMPAERLPRPEGPLPALKAPSINGMSAAAYGPRTGNFKVTLVTVQLAGKSAADVAAIDLTRARASIAQSSSYWKKMSDNRLSMSIAREVSGFKSSARITDSYDQIMATVTREMGWQFKPYEALVIFVPHANLNSYGTWGVLGGGFTDGATTGRIIMPYTSALTNNVVTHEFGHVLGLHHSNSLYCSNGRSDVPRSGGRWTDSACFTNEYGDTMDLMGYAQNAMPTINSFFWEYGGFGRGNEILNAGTVQGAKNYTLKAWSGSDANRAVKFTDPVSKEIYYLELRLPVGYDAALAYGGNRGVKIIKKDLLGWDGNASIVLTPDSRWLYGYYNQNHAWQAGSTFTTHAGTKVKINSVGTTSASITITAPTSGTPAVVQRSLAAVNAGDFNRNGTDDLVSRRVDGTLWFHDGTGNGTFQAPVRIGSGWDIYSQLVGGQDFNNDGRTDLIGRKTDGTLWFYAGTGAVTTSNEGYKPAVKTGHGWNIFDIIVSPGDFNGDRIADLIARKPDGTLWLYAGTGTVNGTTSSVQPGRQISTGWAGYADLVSA